MGLRKYDAILIDTSIYRNYKYKFELGVLKTLSQFKDSDIEFLMTDVIKREVLSHLNESIYKAKAKLESSLKEALDYLFFDGSNLNEHKESILSDELLSSLAEKRIDDFIKSCGINVLPTEDYAPLKKLFDLYFSALAPFENRSEKKHEFPDAAILLTTEEWAKKNGMYVLAVARDGGWKNFCEGSEYIDYLEELPHALTFFQKDTAPYALRDLVKEDLENGEDGYLHSVIIDSAIERYGQFSIDVEAASFLQYENDDSYAYISTIEFDGALDLIDSGEKSVTFSSSVDITYEVHSDFRFYQYDSIDRDYVAMGANTYDSEVTESATLIFTIQYDLGEEFDLSKVEVLDCEIDGILTVAEFGEIEPYRDLSDYYD